MKLKTLFLFLVFTLLITGFASAEIKKIKDDFSGDITVVSTNSGIKSLGGLRWFDRNNINFAKTQINKDNSTAYLISFKVCITDKPYYFTTHDKIAFKIDDDKIYEDFTIEDTGFNVIPRSLLQKSIKIVKNPGEMPITPGTRRAYLELMY